MSSESLNTQQVLIDGVVFFHMPIEVAIKYASKLKSGFFVPLSETKRVRIHLEDDGLTEKMEKYREKGLESILLAEDDYYDFIKEIKRGLISFFLKDDSSGKVLSVSQMLSLLKKVIKYIGIDSELVDVCQEVVEKVIQDTKGVSVVSTPLKAFMRDNQDEFLKSLLVCYTSIGLVDALNWTTPGIKEKIAQICLFSDITLTSKDYTVMLLCNGDSDKFPKHIKEHPVAAAKIVGKTRNLVGKEVIKSIEQHHEKPDGSGYPNRLKGLSISQMSAIQIVARAFIDKVVDSEFSFDDRKAFIADVLSDFNFNNFSQPSKALYLLLGLEPEKQETEY